MPSHRVASAGKLPPTQKVDPAIYPLPLYANQPHSVAFKTHFQLKQMDLKTILPIKQNELRLSVSGRDGLTLVAAIRPTAITTTYVSGEVEWMGAGPPACFIHSIGEETYWGQYLTLVFAAAGPHSAPDVPIFQANQWTSAELTLPDFLGEPGDVVRVSVHSHDWKAQLSVTCQPELTAEAKIPRGLRKLDAVTTVVEMLARMFLGRSWLTLELMPQ